MSSWRRPVAAAVAMSCAVLGGVLALQAADAQRELGRVRDDLPLLRDALAEQDGRAATRLVGRMQARAADARSATDGALWGAVAHVPVLGRTPAAVTRLAATTDDVLSDVLPGLVATADALRPEALRPSPDTVDLTALSAARPAVVRSLAAVDALLPRLAGPGPLLPPVGRAHRELATGLGRLQAALEHAQAALEVLPAALGQSGSRRYFVAFQGDAEARGTGGMVGAYGILTADAGRLSIGTLGDDRTLRDLTGPVLDLGPDFRELYGRDPELWSGTNLSPHFPYAARLWLDKWHAQTGERLDGALATDPTALGYLLQASGPVTLPGGELIRGDAVAALVEQDAYRRFAEDDDARKDFLVSIATAVAEQLLSAAGETGAQAAALVRAVGEGRLLAYSTVAAEEEALSGARLAGEVPSSAAPYAAVVVNNGAGNKLDYYLARDVRYRRGPCRAGSQGTSVHVLLHNDVPDGPLPTYVSGRKDLPRGSDFERGSTKLLVALYATKGAQIVDVTVGGKAVPARAGVERGHPVFHVPVPLARGGSSEVVFRLVEPETRGGVLVPEQPLVRAQRTEVIGRGCS